MMRSKVFVFALSIARLCVGGFVPRGSGDKDGLKVLIIQADDRSLQATKVDHAHYLSMTAVLNLKYAECHGYDYLFLHARSPNMSTLFARFNVSNKEEVTLSLIHI